VARSLVLAAGMAGMNVRVASPAGYQFDETTVDRLRTLGAEPLITDRPIEAVAGADVVYTDVWTSMGQEAEGDHRLRAFEGFHVDDRLLGAARHGAVFLHCLPAHRGEEVTADVVDGPQSRVWVQAANRMHAARGLLVWLLSDLAE
jgi:ornithine carbamoyltransferase